MTYQQDEIRSLNQELVNYQEVAQPAAIEAAEAKRSEAEPELSQLTKPNAFERFLNSFLTEALAELEDGEREELCDCSRPTCPLKNEALPPQVTSAESLDEGIRRYQRDHVGSAKVLTDAREAFAEECGEVKRILREALGLIKQTDIEDSEEATA